MNAKQILLKLVLDLDDAKCEGIVNRILAKFNCKPQIFAVCNSAAFDESKHPRAEDGKWTSGAPGYLRKGEAKKWKDTGKMEVSPKRFPEVLKKIKEAKEKAEYWESKPGKFAEDSANSYKRKLVAAQRELAEKIRQLKHDKRDELEGKAKMRHNAKLVKEYRELDDEIDYMEEKYADRESGSLTDLKWPKGKKGEREKAKYETMKARRDELNAEIDWDRVEDEQE